MHKNPTVRRIMVTVTPNVMRALGEWAAAHLSSLSAEVVCAVRERATQESREKMGR
jgi:hypothetical protein